MAILSNQNSISTFAGMPVYTSIYMTVPKEVQYLVRLKGRGIAIHRKKVVDIPNPDAFVDHTRKVIYMHPETLEEYRRQMMC